MHLNSESCKVYDDLNSLESLHRLGLIKQYPSYNVGCLFNYYIILNLSKIATGIKQLIYLDFFLWIHNITLTVKEITNPITDITNGAPIAAAIPVQLSSEDSVRFEVEFAKVKFAVKKYNSMVVKKMMHIKFTNGLKERIVI